MKTLYLNPLLSRLLAGAQLLCLPANFASYESTQLRGTMVSPVMIHTSPCFQPTNIGLSNQLALNGSRCVLEFSLVYTFCSITINSPAFSPQLFRKITHPASANAVPSQYTFKAALSVQSALVSVKLTPDSA